MLFKGGSSPLGVDQAKRDCVKVLQAFMAHVAVCCRLQDEAHRSITSSCGGAENLTRSGSQKARRSKDVHNRFSDGARVELLMANSSTEVLMVNLSTTIKLWIAHSPCLGIELVIGNSLWSTKALADQPPIACLSFVEHSRPHTLWSIHDENRSASHQTLRSLLDHNRLHIMAIHHRQLHRGKMGTGEWGALANPNSEGTVDKGHREGQRTFGEI